MSDSRITVFDTTLRDGEQSPGCSMNLEEKVLIAGHLDRLGVDVIEAGFPIASEGDFRGVQAVATQVRRPIIAALARSTRKDIDRAWEAIRCAARPRIHVFLATSDLHLQYKLKISRQDALLQSHQAVAYARTLCDDVEFSPEDATRSDPQFLCTLLEGAIEAGATTINIPDTVGYTVPSEFTRLITDIREQRARPSRRRSSPSTATTISASPSPTLSPPSRPAPVRWNAPSTASASAPATPPSKRS